MNLEPEKILWITLCGLMLAVIVYVISVSDNSDNQPPYAY